MRWLIILLLLPMVAADTFELTLPEELEFGNAVWLVGDVDLPELIMDDPVYVNPTLIQGQGTLTACPVDFSSGTIPTVLSQLSADCLNGQSFVDPSVQFDERARLIGEGTHALLRSSQASMLVVGGDGHAAMTLSNDGVRMSGQPFRFAPTTAESHIVVYTPDVIQEFNGTDWAFLFEAEDLFVKTEAMGFRHQGEVAFTMNEVSDGEQLASALSPYTLLDVQELMFGSDAREPRVNVSQVFKEFGRVPEYVNGALVGYLNGTAANKTYDGGTAILVRGAAFSGTIGQNLSGNYNEVLSLSKDGVAFDGNERSDPPWFWIVLGFVVATVAGFIRRQPLRSGTKHRLVQAFFSLLGLLIIDQSVMLGRTGTSALQLMSEDASLGVILALLTFELLLLAVAWILILMPWRFAIIKWVPDKAQWWAQVPIMGAWLLLVWLLPGALFALTYLLARL